MKTTRELALEALLIREQDDEQQRIINKEVEKHKYIANQLSHFDYWKKIFPDITMDETTGDYILADIPFKAIHYTITGGFEYKKLAAQHYNFDVCNLADLGSLINYMDQIEERKKSEQILKIQRTIPNNKDINAIEDIINRHLDMILSN